MFDVRPPGIYIDEHKERRFTPLTLHRSGIPCFIGITHRGPTHRPVRITSMAEFDSIYGSLDIGTYMVQSIAGFFQNGGSECFVLRIAHTEGKGPGEIAAHAQADLKDAKGKPTIRVYANTEGTWGNDVTVTVKRPAPKVQTFLTLNIKPGDTSCRLRSTYGLQRGTIVRFHDDEKEEFRTITDIKENTIFWPTGQPMRYSFDSAAPTYVEPLSFDLEVDSIYGRESYEGLSFAPNSPRYFPRLVNKDSKLVLIDHLKDGNPVPDCYPVGVEDVLLEGGADGAYSITPEDFLGRDKGLDQQTGLFSLGIAADIDLLVAPDLMWCKDNCHAFKTLKDVEVVQKGMLEYCEDSKDKFAILDIPYASDVKGALQWRLLFDSAYGAFFFPWVKVVEDDTTRTVPPSGHISGVIAGIDKRYGVHYPPGNREILGICDLELILHDNDIGRLNREGVNCLKMFGARGIRIWGARTLSSNPQLRYINVRRELNTITKSLTQSLQWVVFEPNQPSLWKTVTRNVSYFLYDLWQKGYFKGRTPEEAFFVKCDEENNTKKVRDAGQVLIDVGVSPVRPAEFVVINVSQSSDEAAETGVNVE